MEDIYFKCWALSGGLDVDECSARASILQGGSGLVRVNVPYVPCLVDCAAIGGGMS